MTASLTRPEPIKGISGIEAYVPGKSSAPMGVKLYKLSANETPLGPGEAAKQAYLEASRHLEDYPDGSSTALREAIGRVHGIDAARIVCGAGSDELLSLLCNCYLQEGDEAIYSQHGFLVYRIGIQAAGATPIVAPESELTSDVDAILERVTKRTRIIFLANPNNPTGTYLPIAEIRRLHAALPGNVMLVLDAAYAEYVQNNDYKAGIELVGSSENVVMTRTFSKIYGLASLRVGWLYGPESVIDVLNRVRGPFNVSAAALAAAAAAIGDIAHLQKSIAYNNEWMAWTQSALRDLGLQVTPSVGNFFLIHFPDIEGSSAAEADDFLTRRGFILRRVTSYGFPNALRMSIGTEEANRGVVAALKEFLGGPND